MPDALEDLIIRYQKIIDFVDGCGMECPVPSHKELALDMKLIARRILRLEEMLEHTQRLLHERTA